MLKFGTCLVVYFLDLERVVNVFPRSENSSSDSDELKLLNIEQHV